MQRKSFFIETEEAAMSTSISKNINHPPSGFNPHAPDPASECIVIRGRSISAQSYSPAKTLKMWKPHWWSAFFGTQKTLSCCFFIVFFLSFKMMNKCEFQRVWRGKKKEQLKLQVPHILEWHYPQGNQHFLFSISQRGSSHTTWLISAHQRQVWASRCIPYEHLQMKWQAQTASLCLWSLFFWFVLC